MTSATPCLWTPKDLAARLQLSTVYLAQLRCTGGGPPYVKVGHQIRYVPAHVMAWLNERAQVRTGDQR